MQTDKHSDRRTAKGLRIRREVHERILAAYIDLIRSGVPAPTARATAELAGLSLRVIFKHFPNLRALRLESFRRMQERSSKFLSDEMPAGGSAAERLEFFIRRHARRLEYVTPLHRIAAMVERNDPDVAKAMRAARDAAAGDLERALGSLLTPLSRSAKRTLLMSLHMAFSWDAWEFLRTHYKLSPVRARAVITDVALSVLAQAGSRAGARQARPAKARGSSRKHRA
jgi:AcrR family transcriptional regulator